MQKLQQRLDLQEHVLRCTDVHNGYHPRNTNDNRCEIECVREFLKDGFYFGAKFVRELTDDEIRDFIGWVRVNGRVSRSDLRNPTVYSDWGEQEVLTPTLVGGLKPLKIGEKNAVHERI